MSETVFHNVPVRGRWRRIRESTLLDLILSYLTRRRDLLLAQLSGPGLRRLRIRRSELIDSEAAAYARTANWAEAVYQCKTRFDGLLWTSRLDDTCRALVLFGTRVLASDGNCVTV